MAGERSRDVCIQTFCGKIIIYINVKNLLLMQLQQRNYCAKLRRGCAVVVFINTRPPLFDVIIIGGILKQLRRVVE